MVLSNGRGFLRGVTESIFSAGSHGLWSFTPAPCLSGYFILFYFCQSCTQIFDLLLVWNLSVSLVLSDCKTGSLPLVAPPDVVIFQHRELNTASCAQHIPFCFLGSFPELFHEHLPHSLAAS